jgi:aconitase A
MNYLARGHRLSSLTPRRFDELRLARDRLSAPAATAQRSTSKTSRPDAAGLQSTIDSSIDTAMFLQECSEVFDGDERWRSLPTPDSEVFEWDGESTYVRKPGTSMG